MLDRDLFKRILDLEVKVKLSFRQQRLWSLAKENPSVINYKFFKKFFLISETWVQHVPLSLLKADKYYITKLDYWEDILKEKEGELFLLFHKREIIGFSLMIDKKDSFERRYVVVNRYYQGEGLSKILLEETFKYCSITGKKLYVPKYTEIGFFRLDKNNTMYSKKYKVELITSVEHDFYD